MPPPNEVRFIGHGQTLSVVLGSCISTILIGQNKGYILAANHIVMARPSAESIIAVNGAGGILDEMIATYQKDHGIHQENVRCLHLLGAGKKLADESFTVDRDNINETERVLSDRKIETVFSDTGSYSLGTYSIQEDLLSLFVENKQSGVHVSISLILSALFKLERSEYSILPASCLEPDNPGFEFLVKKNIITFITGTRTRI
jgi:chemotaxis receptor (MCP) glutamine deamidase CheD